MFQLGTASWRILKVERGIVRVADAEGAPPTLPFWFGEARARTEELSREIGLVREHGQDAGWLAAECSLETGAIEQIVEYVSEGARVLGCVPTPECVVLERFFDESGGMQLVLHAPFGGRINRAFGLALRKRFCRHFGFELQAAANEEAIVLSLGPKHSFPLEEVFDYLHPDSVREVLIQALLPAPMFATRWRWNVTRSLVVERFQGGKRVPPPLLRMRADDQLALAFPEVVACGETLPPGDLPIPTDHPLVHQTLEDCLHEAMDVDGLVRVLRGLRDGSIRRVAVDTPDPSLFSCGILNAMPYAFLDDAPLEERRTQAVLQRRVLDPERADHIGALDPDAVARVREEVWPQAENAEEVHEALLWMGYLTRTEAEPWKEWVDELAGAGRVVLEGERYFAVEATREPKEVLAGRLQALGPVFSEDPLLFELEAEGRCLRIRLDGQQAWCERRLLARIQRYTLERLRQEISPVSASEFLAFLAHWQHVAEDARLEGPAGVETVLCQLAGFEAPARAWEKKILAARVRGYRPDWLDQLTLSGQLAWGRLWGGGAGAVRSAPIALLPRDELASWEGLADERDEEGLAWPARSVLALLRARGAMFPLDLARASKLLPSDLERGLIELVTRGLITNDAYASLRWLLLPSEKRRSELPGTGRWTLLRPDSAEAPPVEFAARVLLRRTGVVFRKLLERERIPVPWRDLARCLRALELRGDVRGGRFVAGFSGEQFALPGAVTALRSSRRKGPHPAFEVSAADPLNLRGILTPDERVPMGSRQSVVLG